jgi:uncharacterized integral membrane protein
MAFLKGLVLLPVAVVVVLLAVANRAPVMFSFDPVSPGAPQWSVTLPLFVLLFAALAIGVLVGGMASWLAQGRHRRAGRAYRREVNHLRQEADRLRGRGQPKEIAGLPAVQRGSGI